MKGPNLMSLFVRDAIFFFGLGSVRVLWTSAVCWVVSADVVPVSMECVVFLECCWSWTESRFERASDVTQQR